MAVVGRPALSGDAQVSIFQSDQEWMLFKLINYVFTNRVFKREFDSLRQRLDDGKQEPCFMSEFIKLGKDKDFDPATMYFIGGTLMEAGSDTTRQSLTQVVAGAALFPDWVERAREQLDEVCGYHADRLPTMEDAAKLPLVRAALKESLRWK